MQALPKVTLEFSKTRDDMVSGIEEVMWADNALI